MGKVDDDWTVVVDKVVELGVSTDRCICRMTYKFSACITSSVEKMGFTSKCRR